MAAESGRKDPQIVVIDEVLGQWLTLAGALRFDLLTFALAFGLFRLFDIWKPPPIRLIEQIPGGAGIVLDDMMAGATAHLSYFWWDGSIIISQCTLHKPWQFAKIRTADRDFPSPARSGNYGRRTLHPRQEPRRRRIGRM